MTKIAQLILSKPHHRQTAPDIYSAAEKSEAARKKYWEQQKLLRAGQSSNNNEIIERLPHELGIDTTGGNKC